MKKVIVSHIYNEEYLLPWWLNYHKKYFDHGIIIDYASTDRSIEIIKEICPTWDIVQSKNSDFVAYDVDREVEEYLSSYGEDVWKIALNSTEFLVGDYNLLNNSQGVLLIPCLYFIDEQEYRSEQIPYSVNLWDVLKTGLDVPFTFDFRGSRALHTNQLTYPSGRHFKRLINTDKFIIFNYGFAPMTEEFYNRKLQIQNKIPQSERLAYNGGAHTDAQNPNGLTRERFVEMYTEYLPVENQNFPRLMPRFTDLTTTMNKFLWMLPR